MDLLKLLERGDVEAFNAQRGRHAAPDLFAADLSNLSLVGVDFSGVNLEKADLSGADLTDAILARTNLTGTDLTGTVLRGVMGQRSRWRYAYLGDTVLDGADFTRADFTGADFTGAEGDSVRWCGARLRDVDFTRCRFPGADCEQANLGGAVFAEADFSGAGFEDTRMGRANLDQARLEGARFSRSRMSGVSARHAHLAGAVLREVDLTGAILEGTDLEGADLYRADLGGSQILEANLRRANLEEARLDRGALEQADTEGASLTRSGPLTLVEDPREESVALHVADPAAAICQGVVGLLWENEDATNDVVFRVATTEGEEWDGSSVALGEPADLVVSRCLMPLADRFLAVLLVKRPGGLTAALTDIDLEGRVLASRVLPFEYMPAVQPVYRVTEGEVFLAGLSRSGPTLHVHRLQEDRFTAVYQERIPTARGFVGQHEPVVVCKGGVVLPLGERGIERPVRHPEGFPGRYSAVTRLGGQLFYAWISPGEQGFHHALVATGDDPADARLESRYGVSTLAAGRFGDEVLVAYTREGESLATPSGLHAVWLPGGRPFCVLPGEVSDLDEVRMVRGGSRPRVAVTTLDGGAVVVTVGRDGGEVEARFPPRDAPE